MSKRHRLRALEDLSTLPTGEIHSLSPNLVGAWHLHATGAPIVHHALIFHSDGTMCSFQADGGFPHASESPGAGVWELSREGQVQGAFEEYRYDRHTHAYLGRVRIEFVVTVQESTLMGTAHAQVFDAQNQQVSEAFPSWSATRIQSREKSL